MAESGQINRLWTRWKAQARQDCFDNGVVALGILNLFTAFLMLALAFILASSIAGVEYYIFKKYGSKHANKANDEVKESLTLDNSSSLKYYRTNKVATKSALAKQWFELAFGLDNK